MATVINKYIVPGNRVDLTSTERKTDEFGNETRKTYSTKVFDVLDDDRIEVLMPMDQTKLILLPVDAVYELYMYSDLGLYQCLGRVIDRYKNNNVYILVFELTTNLRKYQRREYYRYSCALEMQARTLEKEEIIDIEKNTNNLMPGLPLQRSVIVDLSGGGLRFISAYCYPKDSVIWCKYKLVIKGELRLFEVAGKVIDSKPSDNREGVYEHRVQYININADDREELIKYIFEEERKNRRKQTGM